MLNALINGEERSAQSDLLAEIKRQTKKQVSQITVRQGKVINRNITGGIFILAGFAILYRKQGSNGKKVFLDRLQPGRLFYEAILNPDGHDILELVAESDCQIEVANLKHLTKMNRVLHEKISQALFIELTLSCRGAMDQICTLRSSSARSRLLTRARQICQALNAERDNDWRDMGLSAELFVDMSGVSFRQFTRILPELENEHIMKVTEGVMQVNLGNLYAQETE